MTKSNSCICLFPLSTVFSRDKVLVFESMSRDDSSLLYSILYENYSEVLKEVTDLSTIIYCLDEKDKDIIPPDIKEKISDIFWVNSSELNSELKNFNDKYFKKFHNNIIIFAHSIGVTSQDIKKIFSLLEMEDESFFIGRDTDERIALLGFNTYNEDLMGNIVEDRNHYNEVLIKASKHENFVHTLSNFMLMETKEDFKKLYNELSRKESLMYCNQNIHEKFTHLFIEYKDLLK
jgi:hypothetical protein